VKHAVPVALAVIAIGLGVPALAGGEGEHSSDQAFIDEMVRIGILPPWFTSIRHEWLSRTSRPELAPTPSVAQSPEISFEFYRGSGVTGAHFTCIEITSDLAIPPLHMAYMVRLETGTPAAFNPPATCPRFLNIVRPHEVRSVHAQVFSREDRIRRVYECEREESDFSDGYFPCRVVAVSDPLPDLYGVAKEDALFYAFVRERKTRAWYYRDLMIRSSVDIPEDGLYLRGVVDRPVHSYSEWWPLSVPILAGAIENLGAWSPTSDVGIGWMVTEERKFRGIYCAENYENVVVCDSWTVSP